MGVFHVVPMDNGEYRCENIFRNLPILHRQIWITWVSVIVFFIPFVMLVICYTRIFIKVSRKAFQNNSVKYRAQEGKIALHSTHSQCLSKAKIKTLKMTFVILLTFIICSLPYFVVEMIMSYGRHCLISRKLYGILGGMAACNSATNPFVFLAFNIKPNWFKQLKDCICTRESPSRTYVSCRTTSTTHNTHNYVNVKGDVLDLRPQDILSKRTK